MFCLYFLEMATLDTLFLCSVRQQAWPFSLLVLKFFYQNQGLCSYKIFLIKKERNEVLDCNEVFDCNDLI